MDRLQEARSRLHIAHSMKNMQGNTSSRLPNVVVVLSAIPQDNAEILLAKSVGVPMLVHSYAYSFCMIFLNILWKICFWVSWPIFFNVSLCCIGNSSEFLLSNISKIIGWDS